MPSDWECNCDLKSGRVRCHLSADIVMGANRDWSRVSGAKYIIQKLFILLAIPKGEVLNDPDVGCCLYKYLFEKFTDSVLFSMRTELEYDIHKQLPELGLREVTVGRIDDTSCELGIIGTDLTTIWNIHQGDLLTILLAAIANSGQV